MQSNSLIRETSPYLLQHANNPVQWYAWGEEAINKAIQENKPIFLSVGYSACHWCHVMAHESFENEEIARVMNDNFINIKVDREERPDIDDIYQKVCQLTTGSGGWPLSVFLTPEQRPFYVGTYFPPLDNYGRPGFGSLVRQLAQAWKEKPHDVQQAAEDFINALQKTESIGRGSNLEKSILDEGAVNLLSLVDMTNGGFGQAPKFPNASNLAFMLRYSKLSGIAKFQDFVFKTLIKMASGGLYDQLGGGFQRYSTDSRWLVPHFEKMLYDNALLVPVYTEAYQITKDSRYLDVIKGTLRYVLREMTSPEGGFYSAQDADSEGEEGKFYVWKKSEIQKILGSDYEVFCLYYDVTDGGNFEGHTILYNTMSISSVAFHFGKTESEVIDILIKSRAKLFEYRQKRIPPGKDEKSLTSWNSLMISAFVKGYRVTGEEDFLKAATNCITFIENKLTKNGELLHTYKDNIAKLGGYLDDYAYFASSLLDYFETVGSKKNLDLAIYYANYIVDHFWDDEQKNFFFTSDTHEKLIVRTKNNYDLSLPSGNSVAAGVILRLYYITQEKKYLDTSKKIMESLAMAAAENPFGFGQLLTVIYSYLQKPVEITIINQTNKEIINYISKKFIPESIIVMISRKDDLEELKFLQFFTGKKFDNAKTDVYICRDFSCSLPIDTLTEVQKLV